MRRAAAVLTAIMASAFAPALTAHAETGPKEWSFTHDGRDSRLGIDISWAELVMPRTPRGNIVVHIAGQEFTRERLSAVDVWLDARRRNAGPEYLLTKQFQADRDGYSAKGTWRVDTWSSRGRRRACPKMRTTVNYRTDDIRVLIPMGCVSKPRDVRFSVTTWDIDKRRGKWSWRGWCDYVPGERKFSPWSNTARD